MQPGRAVHRCRRSLWPRSRRLPRSCRDGSSASLPRLQTSKAAAYAAVSRGSQASRWLPPVLKQSPLRAGLFRCRVRLRRLWSPRRRRLRPLPPSAAGPVIVKPPVQVAPAASKEAAHDPKTVPHEAKHDRNCGAAPASIGVETDVVAAASVQRWIPRQQLAESSAACRCCIGDNQKLPFQPRRRLPVKRMIMPQTGPRPMYTAPPPSAATTQNPGAAAGGGLQRGQPIFERPRPQGSGGRAQAMQAAPASSCDGNRACRKASSMHPTRQYPAGAGRSRFASGNAGAARLWRASRWPGRSRWRAWSYGASGGADRPARGHAATSRRQESLRKIEGRSDEGNGCRRVYGGSTDSHGAGCRLRAPSPSPTASASRTWPRSWTLRGKDLIATLLTARRLRYRESIARYRAGEGSLRGSLARKLQVISFEDQMDNEAHRKPADAGDHGRAGSHASSGGDHHGPRRSRKDLLAGCDSRDRSGGGRGWRNHAAHRRLQGSHQQSKIRRPSGARLSSWTRRVTKPLPGCVRAAPRSRTLWSSWWRRMTA